MRFLRPSSLLAGFHADLPAASVPELTHVGEEWIPTDYRIPEHAHDVWEFYFQIEGRTRWEVDGVSVPLNAGGLLGVAPCVRHRLISPAKAAHHFFFAGMDIGKVLAPIPAAAGAWQRRRRYFVRRAPEIAPRFRQLVREVTLNASFREEALRLALQLLGLELTRCLVSSSKPASLVLTHPAVVRARELIDHQPGRPWSARGLAAMAGLSPSRLAACFRAEVGLTLHQYLMRVRVEAAKTLLRESDRAITQIAFDLGYASSQHFSTTFRQATGRNPLAFRQR